MPRLGDAFNPTVVRLELERDFDIEAIEKPFNPTVVRLERWRGMTKRSG